MNPRQPNPLRPRATQAERDATDEKIIKYLISAPGARSAAIEEFTSLSMREIDRSLQRLRTAGRIEQRGGHGRWHVTNAGAR